MSAYASHMRVLIRCIGDLKGPDAMLDDLREEDLYRIVDLLPGKESTTKARMSLLEMWIAFETGIDPRTKGLRILWNQEEPDRIFIEKDQFQEILSKTRNDCERLIISFGALMGMRMQEIVDIRMENIVGNTLIIYGKGHGKGKRVSKAIPDSLMAMVDDYISGERKDLIERYGDRSGGFLLLKNSDNHLRGVPINRSTIQIMYKRVSEQTGIKVTSHVMRRFYCTTLADDAGLRSDLDTLRRMMRHNKVDTTINCYLNARPNLMIEAQHKLEEAFNSL